jgi:hypothetical protein
VLPDHPPGKPSYQFLRPILSSPDIDLSSEQQSQICNEVVSFYDLLRDSQTSLYGIDPSVPVKTSSETIARPIYQIQKAKGWRHSLTRTPASHGSLMIQTTS